MSSNVIDALKLVLTDYFLSILFISGGILSLFISRSMPKDKFPVEEKIAKIGGPIYMGLGVFLFFLVRIIS